MKQQLAARPKPRLLSLSLTRATSETSRARRTFVRAQLPYCQPRPVHDSDNGLDQRRIYREVLLRAPTRTPYRRCRSEPGERAAEHEQAQPQSGGCDCGTI